MNKPTISQKVLRRLQRKAVDTTPSSKPQKRDNIFSQSRDTREDRESRQMTMAHKSTFPHAL